MSATWQGSPYGRRRPLFRAFGFPVYVPATAWMGIALIAWINAPTFTQYGGTAATLGYAAGLYLTVYVHELAHALVARATGHRVLGIELGLLGGATSYSPELRPNPKHELRVAIAGPAASLLSGLALYGLARPAASGGARDVAAVLVAVGFMNVVLAAMNLLPSAPLDGGHVCEALVWRLSGSRRLGMRVTAVLGYAIAIAITWVASGLLTTGSGQLLLVFALILLMNSAVLWRTSRMRHLP